MLSDEVLERLYVYSEERMIFTARRYASAVHAVVLSLFVCMFPSVKTAKLRITQTTPHNSAGISFLHQRCLRNLNWVTQRGRQMQVG